MATILQGTTPSLKIEIDTSDFLVSEVVKLEICIWQGDGKPTIYGLSDILVNNEDNSFTISFTEKQTLALTKESIYWQMRCALSNDNIYGTNKSSPINVAELKSKQVMFE